MENVILSDSINSCVSISENIFPELTETALVGMYVIQDGRFVYVNPKMAEITGYTIDELIMLPAIEQLVHPADRKLVRENIQKRLTGEIDGLRYEFRGLTKDNKTVWVEVFGTRTTVEDEPAILGTMIDITNRKQAEINLRERLALEELVANISSQFINICPSELDQEINQALGDVGSFADTDRSYLFQFSDDGRYMSNTHEWCAADISSQKDNLTDLAVSDFPWWMDKLQRGETIQISEVDHMPAEAQAEKEILQGQNICSLIVIPLYSKNTLIGFLGFDCVQNKKEWAPEDITLLKTAGEIFVYALLRKRHEEALEQSEKRFREIFEHMQEGFFQFTPDGEILLVNPQFEEIMEVDKTTDLEGYNLSENHVFWNMDWNDFISILNNNKVLQNFHAIWSTSTGNNIQVRLNVHAVQSKNEEFLYYEGTVEDISDEKALENQLIQAQKMESLGQIAGGIAHDFNNIMATIQGALDLLNTKVKEEPIEKYFHMASASIERGKTVTERLLTFSRPDSQEKEIMDLRLFLAGIHEIASHTLPSTVNVTNTLFSESALVLAEPRQLQQVLINLCINAADAMPEGGEIRLGLRKPGLQERRIYGSGCICMTIEDTGYGMDAETQRKIFDPFFTTKESGKGTGLGLSIAYKIIKNHNGWIAVESEPDEGTKFTIGLPLANMSQANALDEKVSALPKGNEEHILIVEDEPLLRAIVKDTLLMQGYRVSEAENAADAMSLFEEAPFGFNLVITDIGLPDMLGTKLAEWLRDKNETIKIIAITGYVKNDVNRLVESDVIQKLIRKPFQFSTLLKAISAELQQ